MKVLAAIFYVPTLLLRVQSISLFVQTSATNYSTDGVTQMVACAGVLVAIVLALLGFLLGKSMARGAAWAWVLSLVLYCLVVPFFLFIFANGGAVTAILVVAITVTLLTLLLTPAVRRHCAKK